MRPDSLTDSRSDLHHKRMRPQASHVVRLGLAVGLAGCRADSDAVADTSATATDPTSDGDSTRGTGSDGAPGDTANTADPSDGPGPVESTGGVDSTGDDGGESGPPATECDDGPAVTEAPPPQWVNTTGNLANLASECGNLTLLSARPCTDEIIAGVAQQGLFMTHDGGATWNPLGTGVGSAVITNRPSSIVYDPEHPAVFWESGIYNGGGVYRTDDGGVTFVQLGDFGHNDLVSVDFSDPERNTLLAGSHEQTQRLMYSNDGGQSWTDLGPNLPADSNFSSAPLVLDANTFLVGACGYADGTCGVFRSTDTGVTWQNTAPDLAVVARPLWAADDAIYWSTIYDSGIARSDDHGESWMKVADGIVSGHPVALADGRIMDVTVDHVVVSADGGMTWTPVGEPLPFKPAGVTFSASTKTMYVWQWDCGDIVLPNAIASAGFDDTAP